MEQPLICTHCGTTLWNEAKFCRNCGQPSGRFEVASVTEGTTRLLETEERPSPSPFNQGFAYAPLAQQASHNLAGQAQTTRSLEPQGKPHNRLLLSIMVALIVVLMVGTLLSIKLFVAHKTTPTPRVVVTGPQIEPPQPPQPPVPPAPAEIGEGQGISSALIYPGAKVTMQVFSEDEGKVMQLQTTDAPAKVIKWYTERLKPKKIMRMSEENVILEAEEMKAIINGGGNGTSILLTQGDD